MYVSVCLFFRCSISIWNINYNSREEKGEEKTFFLFFFVLSCIILEPDPFLFLLHVSRADFYGVPYLGRKWHKKYFAFYFLFLSNSLIFASAAWARAFITLTYKYIYALNYDTLRRLKRAMSEKVNYLPCYHTYVSYYLRHTYAVKAKTHLIISYHCCCEFLCKQKKIV